MTATKLSERERRDYEALSAAERWHYRNLRESNLTHAGALDLLRKWRTEDEPRA